MFWTCVRRNTCPHQQVAVVWSHHFIKESRKRPSSVDLSSLNSFILTCVLLLCRSKPNIRASGSSSPSTKPCCSHCNALIERRNKGYKRKSLLSVTDVRGAQILFPDLNPKHVFLCTACVRLVFQRTEKSGNRRICVGRRPLSSPAGSPCPAASVLREAQNLKKLKSLEEHDYASQDPAPSPQPDPQPARNIRRGPIPKICSYLRKKNLTMALNRLLEINGFKEALMKTCVTIISSEVSNVQLDWIRIRQTVWAVVHRAVLLQSACSECVFTFYIITPTLPAHHHSDVYFKLMFPGCSLHTATERHQLQLVSYNRRHENKETLEQEETLHRLSAWRQGQFCIHRTVSYIKSRWMSDSDCDVTPHVPLYSRAAETLIKPHSQ